VRGRSAPHSLRPRGLPVSAIDLVINLKAAQEIGHEVPAGLVLRADKLIE